MYLIVIGILSVYTECARLQLADSGVIPFLVEFISDDNRELCLQCVRALGNLCYEQGNFICQYNHPSS